MTATAMATEPATGPVLLDALNNLTNRADDVITRLRATVFAPGVEKIVDTRFPISKAAEMVGRTPEAIRQAEAEGRLPAPRMTEIFGSRPRRAEGDPPIVLAVQNFKGGVGKSTLTCHIAQYLALKGYRVAIIDCDSQASSTTVFGFNPDIDIDDDDTLLPFFEHGGAPTLDYAIRPTAWAGIDLIPANLGLYQAEYEAAARMKGRPELLDRLRDGIAGIADRYDVVLLDPPPALGMISLAVLRAANALLIPTPPSTVDFASTAHFLRMIVDTVQVLDQYGLNKNGFEFLRVVATKVDEGKSAHIQIREMMAAVFGSDMLTNSLLDSAEIDNANVQLRTVYEVASGGRVHERCRNNLDRLNSEIEILIRKAWPSHRAELRRLGVG
ncbi:AAA family ATPase [Caulobacter segnis]|uniref:Chromosome partitioning protein n=1 Tax=Caulobacter segnis TaxID=88688 RepID=A0A2W5X449_9CAUL|nr:AAA family ATPase [Caulobacter segnis]PZR35514.1 MAG: chromosome partitioning protein [Caulobacter segnis]